MTNTPSRALEIEVLKLFELVRKMRSELAQVSHPFSEMHALDTAADQLQTISIESTQASETILKASATIKETTDRLISEIKYGGARPIFETIVEQNDKIADACRFHVILATRIARIVQTINAVEGTLNSLVVTLGETGFEAIPTTISHIHKDGDDQP